MGSEVQVLPGPFRFRLSPKARSPGGEQGVGPKGPASAQALAAVSHLLGSDHADEGGLAQLVEHLLCKQGVSGSNPLASMSLLARRAAGGFGLPAFLDGLPPLWPRPGGGVLFETVNRI